MTLPGTGPDKPVSSATDAGMRLLPSPAARLLVSPLPEVTLKKQDSNCTVRLFLRNSEIIENTQRFESITFVHCAVSVG